MSSNPVKDIVKNNAWQRPPGKKCVEPRFRLVAFLDSKVYHPEKPRENHVRAKEKIVKAEHVAYKVRARDIQGSSRRKSVPLVPREQKPRLRQSGPPALRVHAQRSIMTSQKESLIRQSRRRTRHKLTDLS